MKKGLIIFALLTAIIIIAFALLLKASNYKQLALKHDMSNLLSYGIPSSVKYQEYQKDFNISGIAYNKINLTFDDKFDSLEENKKFNIILDIKKYIENKNEEYLSQYNMLKKIIPKENKINLTIKTTKNQYEIDWLNSIKINGVKFDYNITEDNNALTTTNNKDYGYEKEASDEDKGFAWAVATDEIKARLKAPSTAKFPFSYYSQEIKEVGKNTFIVKSYVDAENSFSARIRTNFMVKFERMGENEYKVLDIRIYE